VQPLDSASNQLLKVQIKEALATLTPRERSLIKLRFGLDDAGPEPWREVGLEFHLRVKRVPGRLKSKPSIKLRHPSRSRNYRLSGVTGDEYERNHGKLFGKIIIKPCKSNFIRTVIIKGAFERLARKYHPDLNKEPSALEQMKQLNGAYEILNNPSKKLLMTKSIISKRKLVHIIQITITDQTDNRKQIHPPTRLVRHRHHAGNGALPQVCRR